MQDQAHDSNMAPGTPSGGKLLDPQERAFFEQAVAGDSPFSKQAHALLAVDAGATRAEAGAQAGLTPGQVKYLLERFRRLRLDLFPEPEDVQPAVEAGRTAELETEVEGKSKKGKKKSGKSARKKNGKSAKKKTSKKSKKGKKSKKKGKR